MREGFRINVFMRCLPLFHSLAGFPSAIGPVGRPLLIFPLLLVVFLLAAVPLVGQAQSAVLDKPTGLTAVAGDTEVALTWTDPGDSTIERYQLFQVAQSAKLIPSDGAADDWFGRSVAVDGDTAVAGAVLDADHGAESGSAYVFTREFGVWRQSAKLTASDGAAGDRFGYSVAVDGDTAVAGAFGDADNGSASGSAYVFTRESGVWRQSAKLTATDGARGDYFGWSVAVDGDTAVVGALFDDDNGSQSGAAYVFTRESGVWSQSAKLTASNGAAGDYFGQSVAVDGDTAVAGAWRDADNGSDSGSAYVFTRESGVWSQSAKLTASNGARGDRFGWSVAVDGDTAVAGAESGAAYVFTRESGVWRQSAKLTASDGAAGDNFGQSVAVDGDTAVAGAYLDDDHGSESGAAYVFTRESGVWRQSAKLTATDGVRGDRFGWSVAVDGDTAVAGAYLDDDHGPESGSAYVFTRESGVWSQSAKLTASDGAREDWFGCSVAVDGDTAVAGAYRDDDNGADSGSAYVFTRESGVWRQSAKLTPSDGARGDASGIP